MTVERFTTGRTSIANDAVTEEILDWLMARREAILIELEAIETILIKHGKLKRRSFIRKKDRVK